MLSKKYDIIIIGAGSAGLSVGLFMAAAGFRVLMIAKSEHEIGGECLNDGCVPSKAIVHVAKLIHQAANATEFGLQLSGTVDINKVTKYIYSKQEIIRQHENSGWLHSKGIDVVLGEAFFGGTRQVNVNDKAYFGKKIVIATGSKPCKLHIPGVELVQYFDNQNIFQLDSLPPRMLMIGGGPIGMELAQALHRLGCSVTVVDEGSTILAQDEETLAGILLQRMEEEGIVFHLNTTIEKIVTANEAILVRAGGEKMMVAFDAVFVGIGREPVLEPLQLQRAGIEVKDGKITVDARLRTTNKNVFVCGDVAGDLQFSHAAEFHARILINNFFSPFKKRRNNDHMSWVTFTDPELATFGLNEKQLRERKISFERIEKTFADDDRAVVNNYRYAKLILLISKPGFLRKQTILGGSVIAPNAGELVQELILANAGKLSIDAIFNKIYPYPTAARINQQLIVEYKQKGLTSTVRKLLQLLYR